MWLLEQTQLPIRRSTEVMDNAVADAEELRESEKLMKSPAYGGSTVFPH